MESTFKGMMIDEVAEELDISDHKLVRTWFKIGRTEHTIWEKTKYEIREWYKKDEESLKRMEEDLVTRLNGPISFNRLMDKIEIAQSRTLKRQRKVKIGRKEGKLVVAAAWVDHDVQSYLKDIRNKNKDWRQARNRKEPQDVLDELEKRYKDQQVKTSRFLGGKKGSWEKQKILLAKIIVKLCGM